MYIIKINNKKYLRLIISILIVDGDNLYTNLMQWRIFLGQFIDLGIKYVFCN